MKNFLLIYFSVLGILVLGFIIIMLYLEFTNFGLPEIIGIVDAYDNDAKFTRITVGQIETDKDFFYYSERVLVENISRNKPYDVEQSKMMIAYFDSVGLSVDELLKMPEIKLYAMFFFKSTHETRKHFVEKKVSTYNGNKTYLGSVALVRCKDDPAKWEIDIDRNLGTADSFDHQGPATKNEFLQNECDPDWYEANKDNELVKYYMELKAKRNINR
jgi:hypothetical protein